MINPNELRIGSIVGYDQGWYQVAAIVRPKDLEPTHRVWFAGSSLARLTYDLEPIPLDEKWFNAFGFTAQQLSTAGKRGFAKHEHGYFIGFIEEVGKGWDFHNPHFLRYIQYVHELQNLFQALTGDELVLNERTLERST